MKNPLFNVSGSFRSSLALAVAVATALVLPLHANAGEDKRAPEVPVALQVPAGNKVEFHAYAIGVQIYVCTQSATDATKFSWVFKAPEAVLYDADGNVVGIHYAG